MAIDQSALNSLTFTRIDLEESGAFARFAILWLGSWVAIYFGANALKNSAR